MIETVFNDLVLHAIQERAMEIHIDHAKNGLQLRMRVDGQLRMVPIAASFVNLFPKLLNHLHTVSGQSHSESDLPIEGKIIFQHQPVDYALFYSSLPSRQGPQLFIRLQPCSKDPLALHQLGMNEEHLKPIRQFLKKQTGLMLVAAPLAQGKSTTLSACLNAIKPNEKKIISLSTCEREQHHGINQVLLSPEKGFDIRAAFRAALQQNPDVIALDEIRNPFCAEQAAKSALAGRLVIGTMCAPDSVSAIQRLFDMNLDPYMIGSSLSLIVHQRLVRMTCAACGDENPIPCLKCRGTGYHGRTGVYEVLRLDEELRAAILGCESPEKIRDLAVSKGMETLFTDGFQKAQENLTTVEEVIRATEE